MEEEEESNVNTDAGFITVGSKRQLSTRSDRDPRKFPRQFANLQDLPPVKTTNRYEALPVENIEIDADKSAEIKTKKPPPIHLSDVNSYEKLVITLKSLSNEEFTCKGGTAKVIIYPSTPAQYRLFIKYLKTNNAIFYTYQLPEEKPHRVVLRGLHYTTNTESIKQELTTLGYNIRGVVNIISREKIPLPMFYIDLEQDNKTPDIYKLSHLLHSIVRVEEMRRNKNIIQCTRCQEYNHSKTYCNQPPRCCGCGGSHFTKECKKDKKTQPTCALCNGHHTANYKGCAIFQELQHKRQRPSTGSHIPQQKLTDTRTTNLSSEENFPVIKKTSNQHTTQLDPQPHRTSSQYNSRRNLITSNKQSYSNVLQGEYHSVSDVNSITSIMSEFITDIKNLVLPLMSLLTQLTQALLNKNAP